MAYTNIKSHGTNLTTIDDGTINTTSTSLGLPGRNYAGYGQVLDTNFVHQLENYAASTLPANPLREQLWFNTNNSTLNVCPTDGESNASAWLVLTATSSGGNTTFGTVNVTGNLTANNLTVTNDLTANAITASYLTISANANIANANLSGTTTVANLVTTSITTGSATTAGTLTGVWTINGSAGGSGANAVIFNTGGIYISNSAGANLFGIKCDKYMYANGDAFSPGGNYGDSNVAAFLPTYNGNILTVQTQATVLTTGANSTAGTITGNWTLTAGSRLQATYADLAERAETDREYPIGTVVKIGGDKEITEVNADDGVNVLGVVSNTAAYLMNSGAGSDSTHPAIALVGRVQVRLVGKIKKGDKIAAANNGCATYSSDAGFGWAMETSQVDEEKMILCVIK